jgi:nucleoside-diphosphate-sugar epimerase
MIGDGKNRKSLAYVENVAAFLEFSLNFNYGIHIYNYIDKPDLDMNSLVKTVYKIIGKKEKIELRVPYVIGLFVGQVFDILGFLSRKKFPISKIRVEKFCKNTSFSTKVEESGFNKPIDLLTALNKTVIYEFIEENHDEVFISE